MYPEIAEDGTPAQRAVLSIAAAGRGVFNVQRSPFNGR
jgi:hypothetical protein